MKSKFSEEIGEDISEGEQKRRSIGEKMTYDEAKSKIKYIQGKVLTVVDASFTNKEQCVAVKSLLNHIFSEELTKLYNWTHPKVHMLTEGDMVQFSGSVEQFQEDNKV